MSTGGPQSPPPVPLAELTSPLLLGHLFNWGLFGVLTVQAYIYYSAFPHDKPLPKYLALSIYVAEVLQTVLATRDAFRIFGTGWGNIVELNAIGWIWFSIPIMSCLVSSCGQLFYAWRIKILSRSYIIPAVVVTLSLIQAGAGIYTGGVARRVEVSQIQNRVHYSTSIWLGGTASCDVITAVAMTYYLLDARTGIRATNDILIKLVRLTIETGAICAAFAIVDLSLFLAFEHNNYHLAPATALCKLYSNSVFVVLNSRVRIIGGRNASKVSDDPTLSVHVIPRGQPIPLHFPAHTGHTASEGSVTLRHTEDNTPVINNGDKEDELH